MCYARTVLRQVLLVAVYLNTELAKLAPSPLSVYKVSGNGRELYTSRFCWLQPKNRKEAVNTRANLVISLYALILRIQGHSASDSCRHVPAGGLTMA